MAVGCVDSTQSDGPSAAPDYSATREALFDDLAPTVAETVRYRLDRAATNTGALPPLHIMLEDLELVALTKAREISGGNVTRAAELLGITRDAFNTRMKRLAKR